MSVKVLCLTLRVSLRRWAEKVRPKSHRSSDCVWTVPDTLISGLASDAYGVLIAHHMASNLNGCDVTGGVGNTPARWSAAVRSLIPSGFSSLTVAGGRHSCTEVEANSSNGPGVVGST